MSYTGLKCFSPYTNDGRQLFVSYFFDKLGRSLMKVKMPSKQKWLDGKCRNHFDLNHEKLRALIEFKGSSAADQIKLFEDQLESQLKELGFPIDDGLTLIFSYRNKEKKRDGISKKGNRIRRRLLKNCAKSHYGISKFLTKNTNEAYAVETKFLEKLMRKKGTTDYERDLIRNRRLASIKRSDFKSAAKNIRETLANLGLSADIPSWLPPGAKSIPTRVVETKIGRHSVNFKLFLLLPNGLKVRLLRHLNGVVKKTLD